tara:strand:- start:3 stop:602 length:600 start_codon:yes stop_codon:yes gene_type:complete
MTKQKINIIDFETLYNILNEIKSNLSFNIFNYRKENDFIKDLDNNNKDLNNSVIIVKSQSKKLLDHIKVDKRKIIYFESLPLSLTKLVEKINILLIQQRYDYQSKINIKNYILDLNSRTIVNNNKYLKLTEKEIDIILFLNDSKKPEKTNVLQSKVWGYSQELETHTVETHIYRLRKKIRDSFNDENFILSLDDGYSIK